MKLRRIKKGDTVGIVCPAGGIDRTSDRFILLEERLTNLGLKIKYGNTVGKRYGYLGGTDKDRIQDINSMFADKSVSIIIAMLGGYGCSRIVDKLDYNIIKKNPKLFMGFSDITVLLNSIYQRTKIPTIHGPVGMYLGKKEFDEFSLADFEELIFKNQKNRILKNPNNDAKTLVGGRVQGKLVGGNLCLISTLIGTDYEIDFTDKIVFIEEVDEKPYSIDRYFSSLRLSKSLEKAKGFVFGYFTNCSEENNSFNYRELISQYFAELKVPVIYDFASGHDFPFVNLPIGIEVELDADKKTMKILEEIYEAD